MTFLGQRLALVNATLKERRLENEMKRERRIDTKFSLPMIPGKLSTNSAEVSCPPTLLQESEIVAVGSVREFFKSKSPEDALSLWGI